MFFGLYVVCMIFLFTQLHFFVSYEIIVDDDTPVDSSIVDFFAPEVEIEIAFAVFIRSSCHIFVFKYLQIRFLIFRQLFQISEK